MKKYGNMYRQQHTRTPCPECKTTNYTLKDSVHDEIWCHKCGLILSDTTLPSITSEIEKGNLEYQKLRDLHRKKKGFLMEHKKKKNTA